MAAIAAFAQQEKIFAFMNFCPAVGETVQVCRHSLNVGREREIRAWP